MNLAMNHLVSLLILVSVFHINLSNATPGCSSQPGVCWAVGDPHVRNFAGETKLFSATGKVLMLSDKKSIWIRTKLVNTGRATSIVTVFIDLINQGKRTHIVFNRDTNNIFINHKVRPLPYKKWGVTINPVKYGVIIDSDGIHIKWLNQARLFITMDKKYQGKVDGECGTYCGTPAGRGYSSSSRNKVAAALALDKPYNKDYSNLNSAAFGQLATEVEISIRKLFDPTFVGVKVTGAKSGSTGNGRKKRSTEGTIVLTEIELKPDEQEFHSANIQQEIQKKIVEGKDKEGHSLAEILHALVLGAEVSDPEVEMDESDFAVEPEITASDEEDDAEIEEELLQGQGAPFFGQSQESSGHIAPIEEIKSHHVAPKPVEVVHHVPVVPVMPSDVEMTTREPTHCVSKGEDYADGSTIEESYGTCTCVKGKWECHNGFGICAVYGESNVETFDEHHLKLDKECNYHLVSDCGDSPRFSVSTQESFECTENMKEKRRTLVLTVGEHNIMMIGNKEITYNGVHVHQFPHTINVGGSSGVITITEDERKVKISLNNELTIEWNRKLYFGITLRRSNAEQKTCGMCGNFNGVASDDTKLPEHESECRAKHPGCHKKDPGFDHPKQLYDVNCNDIEKVEFPLYGEACKPIRNRLLSQCKVCVDGIPSACLRPSNVACIKQKEKTCVTDLFAHFLRTCYAQVFTGKTAHVHGSRKRRDLSSLQLKHAISSVDLNKMSIEDINEILKNPQILD